MMTKEKRLLLARLQIIHDDIKRESQARRMRIDKLITNRKELKKREN